MLLQHAALTAAHGVAAAMHGRSSSGAHQQPSSSLKAKTGPPFGAALVFTSYHPRPHTTPGRLKCQVSCWDVAEGACWRHDAGGAGLPALPELRRSSCAVTLQILSQQAVMHLSTLIQSLSCAFTP